MQEQKNAKGEKVMTNTSDFGCRTVDAAADAKKAAPAKASAKSEGEE